MSIESKIKELLEESQTEQVIDETVEEVTEAEVKPAPKQDEPSNKKNAVDKNPQGTKAMKEEAEDEEVEDEEVEDEVEADEEGDEEQVDETYGAKKMKKKMRMEDREITVDVSEDVSALVEGEELSEDFKTKAATIFEAAVVSRVKAELASLEEEFETRLDEEVETIKEGLVDKVDGYLDYVVEQWIERNEIALESGIKSDILEGFVGGLKDLFEQHYIDVPEEKFDVMGEMESKIAELEARLDETVEQNVTLNREVTDLVKEKIVEAATEGLSDTDSDKFKGLAEELSFEDVDTFSEKLQTIRESYFGEKKKATFTESVVSDEPAELVEEAKVLDPAMAKYANALKTKY